MDRMEEVVDSIGLFGFAGALCFALLLFKLEESREKDKWPQMKSKVLTTIWPLAIISIVCTCIAIGIYIPRDPDNTMYFLLALCCLAVGLAYSTLIISIISR